MIELEGKLHMDIHLAKESDLEIIRDIVLSNTYLAVCDEKCVGTITINEREISRLLFDRITVFLYYNLLDTV